MFKELFTESARRFGETPRQFMLWDRLSYLHVPRPAWLARYPDDHLITHFQSINRVMRDGLVVSAHVVQANTLLFGPGKSDCPADILFSLEDTSLVGPEELEPIAHSLYQLKNTTPQEPRAAIIAQHLTNERTRVYGLPVPEDLSPRFPSFLTTSFIVRKHLPGRRLAMSFFPAVVSRTAPHVLVPLPSRYWSEPLVDLWRRMT